MLREAAREAVVGGRLVVGPHQKRPLAQALRERVLKDLGVGLVRNKREPAGEGPRHDIFSLREEAAQGPGAVLDSGLPAPRVALRVVVSNELSVVVEQCSEFG